MLELPGIGFCRANKNGFKNYANCSGRIRRSEYWYFILFFLLMYYLLAGVFILFELGIICYHYEYNYYRKEYEKKPVEGAVIASIIVLVISMVDMIIPSISATVRRLHDVGKGGHYIWILLIPLVWMILLFVYLCQDSIFGNNEYGPSPKYTQYTNQLYFPTPVQNNQNYEYPSYDDGITPNNNISAPINNIPDNNNINSNNNIYNNNINYNNNSTPAPTNAFDNNTYT